MKPKRLALFLLAAVALLAAALAYRRLYRPAPRINPPVEIQDRKTIDFSSGKPVVKDSAKEQALIDAAVKEIDDAVKDVTFGPPPAAPAPTKK